MKPSTESPLEYVVRVNWPHREHGEELHVQCPWCGYEKLDGTASMAASNGVGNCKRANNCGRRWNLYQFREKTGDQTLPAFYQIAAPKTYKLPGDCPPDAETAAKREAMLYIQSRGLDCGVAANMGVRVCVRDGSPAIMFPVLRDGIVINRKYRKREGGTGKAPWKHFSQEKDAEPGLFGRDAVEDLDGCLTICEGEFDLIALRQCDITNCVSVPNASDCGWIDAEWGWLQGFKSFFLMLDHDPAGDKACAEIVRRLGADRCFRVRLPEKDANDCVLKRGWKHPDFRRVISDAQEFRPKKLKSLYDVIDDALAARNSESAVGDSSPYPSVTHRLKGYRGGEMTAYAGDDGTGKTTMMLNLAVHFAVHKVGCCVGSFELQPARYVNWMLDMVSTPKERETDEGARSKLVLLAPYMWLVDHVGQMDPDELIEIYQYAASRYGVGHFVTDSLMMLDLEEDDYAAQAAWIKRVKAELVDRFNVHHHLLCHAKKGITDKTTGRDKASIKGSKVISSIHDNVMMVVRDEDDDGTISSSLHVKKVREIPGPNLIVKMRFDEPRRTFQELAPTRDNSSWND